MNDAEAVEILMVEDNPQDLEMALRALRKDESDESYPGCPRRRGGAGFHLLPRGARCTDRLTTHPR